MFQVSENIRKIAKKTVDNALPIKQHETVAFSAGIENLDLAYAFAAELETRGIETIVQSQGDYIQNDKLLKAPIERFENAPKLTPGLIDLVDWYILMAGSRFDASIYRNQEFKERIMEVKRREKWSVDNLLQYCLETNTHLVAFLDPNLQQAKALGKPYEETREMFLSSLDIDYATLTKLGDRIIDVVSKGGEIHLTCPKEEPWKDGVIYFVVVDKNTHEFLGIARFYDIKNPHHRAFLGVSIYDPEHRMKSYGTDATRLMLWVGFHVLGLHSIYLDTMEDNERAIRVAEKAGFKKIGVFRETEFVDGEFRGLLYMDILKDEFMSKYPPGRTIEEE